MSGAVHPVPLIFFPNAFTRHETVPTHSCLRDHRWPGQPDVLRRLQGVRGRVLFVRHGKKRLLREGRWRMRRLRRSEGDDEKALSLRWVLRTRNTRNHWGLDRTDRATGWGPFRYPRGRTLTCGFPRSENRHGRSVA